MNKLMLSVLLALTLSACSAIEKQSPVCSATANAGGQDLSVIIYGIRKVAGQTQYRAGYPFNWRWVNKNNFTRDTCH